jgi:hypothetical protein
MTFRAPDWPVLRLLCYTYAIAAVESDSTVKWLNDCQHHNNALIPFSIAAISPSNTVQNGQSDLDPESIS